MKQYLHEICRYLRDTYMRRRPFSFIGIHMYVPTYLGFLFRTIINIVCKHKLYSNLIQTHDNSYICMHIVSNNCQQEMNIQVKWTRAILSFGYNLHSMYVCKVYYINICPSYIVVHTYEYMSWTINFTLTLPTIYLCKHTR